jgi:hypothetical protein
MRTCAVYRSVLLTETSIGRHTWEALGRSLSAEAGRAGPARYRDGGAGPRPLLVNQHARFDPGAPRAALQHYLLRRAALRRLCLQALTIEIR